MKNEKLKELYELLKEECENYEKDLSYDEGELEKNESLFFPEGLEYLQGEDFVCCNQKLIFWHKDRYLVCCLYNLTRTMFYFTPKGVLGFLEGENCIFEAPKYPRANEEPLSEYEKGFNDGIYSNMRFYVIGDKHHFLKNTYDNILAKDSSFEDINYVRYSPINELS